LENEIARGVRQYRLIGNRESNNRSCTVTTLLGI
jgi:hypothetical protein